MIFSSNAFVFAFLPVALIGYYLVAAIGHRLAGAWLVLMSLVFYGYWNPSYLLLLLGSITWNYSVGAAIFALPGERARLRLAALWAGIAGNLLLLGYYKYLFPLIGFLGAHHLAPAMWEGSVVLPLGISFFTFTQIGYLVDSHAGVVRERGLLSYLLFVTFFPHLIAGPILHNREMMPQFGDPATFRPKAENFSVGLAIFAIGIAKKVLLADPLGIVADAGFAHPETLGAAAAGFAVLAYAFQLYFDFSGYSDMAIGIARLFGVTFPVNFASPYRATGVIDYWARWHMTLTRYLTLYLYNPVAMQVVRWRVEHGRGVSRKATRTPAGLASMVILPTFTTMTLSGIWHGAGLQFLLFGLLHAAYLSINQAWRNFRPSGYEPGRAVVAGMMLATFCAVVVGQIFFRSNSAGDAVVMLGALAGSGGAAAPGSIGAGANTALRIAFGAALCLLAPNTQQIMRDWRPVLEAVPAPPLFGRLRWRPDLAWTLALGPLLLLSLLRMSDTSKFLYFQF